MFNDCMEKLSKISFKKGSDPNSGPVVGTQIWSLLTDIQRYKLSKKIL
jgi:hypothetical protein